MAITPTGFPVWVRANDHTTYGGNVNKIDYQAVGPVNARTDIGAAEFCRATADLSAVGKTCPFASFSAQFNDTVPGVPTIATTDYLSMAGGPPTSVRNGDGDVTFTWLASYSDQYSVSGLVNIVHAEATVQGISFRLATVELLDLSVSGLNESVRVRVWDVATATAAIDPLVSIVITTGTV